MLIRWARTQNYKDPGASSGFNSLAFSAHAAMAFSPSTPYWQYKVNEEKTVLNIKIGINKSTALAATGRTFDVG